MLCLEIRESHSRSSAISNNALASLEAEGFTREEASSELGHRGRDGALASLVAQGIAGEGEALSEQGCQKYAWPNMDVTRRRCTHTTSIFSQASF